MLQNSSPATLQQTLQQLTTHFQTGKWIASTNRYLGNCTDSIHQDLNRGTLNHSDLAQYIAASVALHCADGWSYLGRALECHACGDGEAASHLAYYAELRAAMSLLAAEGQGIFNTQHIIVDSHRNCRPISRFYFGTHEVAWFAFKTWAFQHSSADLLADIVRPNGIPLREWLDAFSKGAGSWRPVAYDWLIKWGIDLQLLAEDRTARNEVSYLPTRLSYHGNLNASECLKLLTDLWSLYHPSSLSPFDVLDQHLLRLSLETAYNNMNHRSLTRAQLISTMLDKLSISGTEKGRWQAFLNRQTSSTADDDPRIVKEAKGRALPGDPRHHLQVISRSALLLRIATGIAGSLLQQSGFTRRDLEFWWKHLGEDRGLWAPADVPDDFLDLWSDVDEAITAVSGWINGHANPSQKEWRTENSNSVWALTVCERVALWGLGLPLP